MNDDEQDAHDAFEEALLLIRDEDAGLAGVQVGRYFVTIVKQKERRDHQSQCPQGH